MYTSKLDFIDTQIAIRKIKTIFESKLTNNLGLLRVSAPLFLESSTGLNDDLNGTEFPVSFTAITDKKLEIVQSLAKWKRMTLHKYSFSQDSGIYADMNAIRPNEEVSPIHSLYVDQWDWEKVLSPQERNINKLKSIVEDIYQSIYQTEGELNELYPQLTSKLPEKITFITSQELEDMFPSLTVKEKELKIAKMHKAVFIIGIGGVLSSGKVHDKRAPDYDDWSLNGDILFYHNPLDVGLEISSMGIRVDSETMKKQLKLSDKEDRLSLNFHKMVLDNIFPLSVGGGIGQSRLSMFLLEKAHIGEVQSSIWSEQVIKNCESNKIFLL
ncbi:aspartate--ammonia ligase [Ichthyobacterium seriolicida]|uniref:Aspartate--ammonia ligase n=1 Tax=Ichthyobacterium seriolicida TaxID=242600 RepID=A0A1J1DXB1_9FLAO|nr:aspartate--ammonia ligase [Ichthyobacterium seriolicida]BAV94490.1 asparagine synthase [Ichthyobacterium seriolicida]